MNRYDTLILQALDTAGGLPTAEVRNRINKAMGVGGFCTDRVRYRLGILKERGYTCRTTGTGACPRISWSLTDAGKAVLVHGEPKKRPPVRRYEVVRKMDVGGFSNTYFARSRGSAIYKAWLDWCEIAPDSTFIEFRKRCSAHLSPGMPTGCYGYVKRFYGLQVDAGDRIKACGKSGIVVPHTANHHVHFVPEGQNHSVPVHPSDVTVIKRRAEG